MVDPSRPQSRPGRSTRNNPIPEVADANPPTVSASTTKHAARPHPRTRNRHPSQSNTLLSHGFTKANSDVKPTAPSVPARAAGGHKRTRSAATDQQDPLPNGGPANKTVSRKQNQRQNLSRSTHPSSSIAFADNVKTAPTALNGTGKAAGGSGPTNGQRKALSVPAAPQKRESDKRTLRSQDGTSRLNSDLAIYFGNFDDVMNNIPTDSEPLVPESKILIVDEPVKAGKGQSKLPLRGKNDETKSPSKTSPSKHTRRSSDANGFLTAPAPSSSAYPARGLMNGAQSLDLTAITATYTAAQTRPETDPLADDYYLVAHRRGERKEKQLRNQEREHAQHEKGQLEGLLEGLKGPDWLRVMGITGITEGESKDWKPKRDYFLKEVQALLDKFALWREEEKRMKLERDAKLAVAETEGEDEEEAGEEDMVEEAEEDDAEEVDGEGAEREEEEHDDDDDSADTVSTGPNSSDLDASAAAQLLEEASNAHRRPEGKRQVKLSQKALEVKSKPPAPPPGPFTSFYPAPHLRSQALGKQRHGGRKEIAFGRPVPDVADADFVLPKEMTSPDALRIHERKRRRLRRDAEEQKKEPDAQVEPTTSASAAGGPGRSRRSRR